MCVNVRHAFAGPDSILKSSLGHFSSMPGYEMEHQMNGSLEKLISLEPAL